MHNHKLVNKINVLLFWFGAVIVVTAAAAGGAGRGGRVRGAARAAR